MTKGYIMVDMPETCQHIRGNPERGCVFGGVHCGITHENVVQHVHNGTKPYWCPVRNFPEMKPERNISEYEFGGLGKAFDQGFNCCLSEIKKER